MEFPGVFDRASIRYGSLLLKLLSAKEQKTDEIEKYIIKRYQGWRKTSSIPLGMIISFYNTGIRSIGVEIKIIYSFRFYSFFYFRKENIFTSDTKSSLSFILLTTDTFFSFRLATTTSRQMCKG